MDKPTDEQVGKFWEWCGFEERECNIDKCYFSIKHSHLYNPFGKPDTRHAHSLTNSPFSDGFDRKYYIIYPPIDLNSLLQYAVNWDGVETIQFSRGDDGYHCWLYMKKVVGKPFHGNGLTEEDALFWALWKIKEETNDP